ncbi:hypothetical protein [Lewinella sp. LCG006]|uniref:hypothetical protein n=1 Tax=Lewinella sp. LCG006 TaxID=3231911 RepID=UPI0034605D68
MKNNNGFRLSKEFERKVNRFATGDLNIIRICDSIDDVKTPNMHTYYRELFKFQPRWHALNQMYDTMEFGVVAFEKIYHSDFPEKPEEVPAQLNVGFPDAEISFSPKYSAYIIDQRKDPTPIL